jgi:peptidyl-tRNA hydrolase
MQRLKAGMSAHGDDVQKSTLEHSENRMFLLLVSGLKTSNSRRKVMEHNRGHGTAAEQQQLQADEQAAVTEG